MRVAREGGAYPLMSRGDINLYSLFVERAQALIRPEGAAGPADTLGRGLRPDRRPLLPKPVHRRPACSPSTTSRTDA